jgi:hypothetical protein
MLADTDFIKLIPNEPALPHQKISNGFYTKLPIYILISVFATKLRFDSFLKKPRWHLHQLIFLDAPFEYDYHQ